MNWEVFIEEPRKVKIFDEVIETISNARIITPFNKVFLPGKDEGVIITHLWHSVHDHDVIMQIFSKGISVHCEWKAVILLFTQQKSLLRTKLLSSIVFYYYSVIRIQVPCMNYAFFSRLDHDQRVESVLNLKRNISKSLLLMPSSFKLL